MLKRVLGILLAVIMVFSLLPIAALAGAGSFAVTNGTPESDSAKNHGYITVDKTAAAAGETVTVTVNPAQGYRLKSLTGTYTVPEMIRITVENDGNGTAKAQADGVDVTFAEAGATVTLLAAPNDGYRFAEWQVVSGGVTVDENDQFRVGTEDVKIKAIFAEITTVADILPAEFPTAESEVSGAPASAWKSATLDQLCYLSYGGSTLVFYCDAGDPDKSYGIPANAALSSDEDGNFIYTDGDTVTVTFSMTGEGGALNSVTVAATGNTTWNGTYQGSACVAAGTMITLSNGEQIAVEDLEIGMAVRTFDHENGEVSSAPVCFIWKSQNAANAFTLTFDGGVKVTVIEAHGFFDREENRYVFLNVKNAGEYIGHSFYHADSGSWLALQGVERSQDRIDAYAIATSKHLNHLSNGMLSMCDGTFERIANLFAYDEGMKYDEDLKQKDIADHGLTSPETVLAYEGFNQADYDDYNLQYLNIALGKGLISAEWVEALSEYCAINNIYDSFPGSEVLNTVEIPNRRLLSAPAPEKPLGSASAPETQKTVEITTDEQGKFTFLMPAYPVVVTAEFEETPIEPDKPVYKILSGADSRWAKGSENGVIVTANGAYDKFAAAYIDGKRIPDGGFKTYPALIAVDPDDNGTLTWLAVGPAKIPTGEELTDRGRQLAVILDDYGLTAIPLGGYTALPDANGSPRGVGMSVIGAGELPVDFSGALVGRVYLVLAFPNTAAALPTIADLVAPIDTGMWGRPLEVTGNTAADGREFEPAAQMFDSKPLPGGAKIRIRGIGALNADDPLYVVDGASLIIMINVTSRLPENGAEDVPEVSALTGIELKPDYLETLAVGNHTLTLVYEDGTEVSTGLEITGQVTPPAPVTGDTGDMTPWLAVLVLSFAGLCACGVFGKKKNCAK